MELEKPIPSIDSLSACLAKTFGFDICCRLKFPALLAELGISERPSQLYFLQCKGVPMKKEITCPAYPYTNRMEQARINDFISVIQHEGMAVRNSNLLKLLSQG